MTNQSIEPRSKVEALAPLTIRPRQHARLSDYSHLINFAVSSLGCICPKPRDVAPPKLEGRKVMHRLIICPNFKFLALAVLEYLSPYCDLL